MTTAGGGGGGSKLHHDPYSPPTHIGGNSGVYGSVVAPSSKIKKALLRMDSSLEDLAGSSSRSSISGSSSSSNSRWW